MGLEERTAAYVLQQAGYRTGLVGKYLNGYTSQVGDWRAMAGQHLCGWVAPVLCRAQQLWRRSQCWLSLCLPQTAWHVPKGWDRWFAFGEIDCECLLCLQ